ncbi:MAG: hypothetical protein WD712_00480 [Candidatus Spechtbacterales bacterium]
MDYKITINRESDEGFEVLVEGDEGTVHNVSVDPEYMRRLGYDDPEELVRKSFDFLLEREPNTSILREFDLSDIETYFPEYPEKIKNINN